MKYLRLWVACLALVPLTVCPALAQVPSNTPAPAAPALTGPITKISFIGLKNISQEAVQAQMTVKPGILYTPEAAQKGVDALKGMGFFNSQITVAATPASPSGVSLAYTVAENPVIQSIHITANTPSGLPTIPAAELIAQMKTRTGEVLNTNILVHDLDNLFNHTTGYVYRQGFVFDVSSAINIDPKTGVLTIPLVEYYIKSIGISGNSRIKTADILAQMHTKTDGVLNTNTLNEDVSKLYETGDFCTVNYTANSKQPGEIDLKLNIVEQPAATGTLDEKQGKVIPFLYDPLSVSVPVVQASINGHAPLPFAVDTGTTAAMLLDPWAVKELGLSPNSKVEKANNFSFSRVAVKSVVFQGSNHDNDASFDAQEAFMTDLSIFSKATLGPPVAGVVGIGLLRSVTARFDFAARTLTVFSEPHAPLQIPGGITLPLRTNSEGIFTVRATLAADTHADLAVDTGSMSTQIPLAALGAVHPEAIAFSNGIERIDCVYLCPALRLPALVMHNLRIPDVVVDASPIVGDPSLGMDILADYRLTLDGPNAQLILNPAARSGRYSEGWAGVEIKPLGSNWVVSELRKGSPAQRAGLQVGDTLGEINEIRIPGLSRELTKHLLSGLAGRRTQVTVERHQSKVVISWVALDVFSAPPAAMDGLSIQRDTNSFCMILNVIKGCSGDLAGLQAGDQIIKIDGDTVAEMSLDHLSEEVKKSTLQVEVERPSSGVPFTVWLTAPKQPVSSASSQ